MGKTKEQIRAEADALFLDLDAEFGKKPKKEKKVVMSKPPVMSEGAQANRMAELMSANSNWEAKAFVAVVVIQTCKCCGGDSEYLGNTMIRFVNKLTRIQWNHHVTEVPDHTKLPFLVDTHYQDVEQCPSCVRLTMHVQDVNTVTQFKLFH